MVPNLPGIIRQTTSVTLAAGTRLGPYEIVAPIGAGGMGEVYKARDTKLGRDVAIKVLPDLFANDLERLARFHREAQVLASLNHPNIAHIYGVEDSSSTHGLVMELVEGPTLADRITQGPIPLAEALPIAKQIAEALQTAHEQGIIHRDLKPANIKIREDGTVKVLDFGLAKAMESVSGARAEATASPTITTPAMTAAGVILGTAAYMAPEQAKGRPADKRSDVWAFGCVLYEMVTGTRAFEGEDVSDTLASVLAREPDWTAIPSDVPPAIRALLKRCLEKDRKQRIADVSTAYFLVTEHATLAPAGVIVPPQTGPVTRRHVLTTAGVSLVVGILLTVVAVRAVIRPDPTLGRSVTRFTVALASTDSFTAPGRHLVAFSPDGTRLAYAANNRLYLRALDQLEATPIRGTDGSGTSPGTLNPFFSPDGQWIGFWQGGQLKRVSVNGGAPVVICAAAIPFGVSWEDDGTILFGQGRDGLSRVSAEGGKPDVVVRDPGGLAHGPQLLPGGRAVLFTFRAGAGDPDWNSAQIVVQSLDTGKRQVVIDGGTDARYLATGHLVYVTGGTLLAVPFDVVKLKVTGGPVSLVENIPQSLNTGAAQFSTSRTGSLVYVGGGLQAIQQARTLVWVDRQGHEDPLKAPARAYAIPRVSPDGKRVALDIRERQSNVWTWDLARETLTRVTFGPDADRAPIWTPDGGGLIFASQRGGSQGLFWHAADGTGTDTRLTQSARAQTPNGISPDGAHLVFYEQDNIGASRDLMMLTLGQAQRSAGAGRGERAESSRVTPLVQTSFDELNGEISPDGRWLAYQSNESGQQQEVYVRPFPAVTAGKWQISTGGGTRPVWARNGQELFYLTPMGALMSVRVVRGATWTTGASTKLFQGPYSLPLAERSYDVSPDGQRFLMIKPIGADRPAAAPSLVVVQNWTEELKRLVPTKR